MSLIHSLNAGLFFVEAVIVGLILREAHQLARGAGAGARRVPTVVYALGGFFLVDALVALNRSELLWSRSGSFAYATGLDLAALVLLTLVFLNTRTLVRAALSVVDMAAYRATEYERARRDYTQVVRHRIMNPLTVIDGAARTLQAQQTLDERTRQELLQAIVASAASLKDVTLQPERRDELERDLSPVPSVAPPERSDS